MLPYDYSRCSDGPLQCPQADQCARTQWPSDWGQPFIGIPVSSFWSSRNKDNKEGCYWFIDKEEWK